MRTPRNAAQPAGPVYDHTKTMASFSTIPEQTPLLDEARPKQRKFAATTVAVLEGHRPQVPAPYTPPKNKTTKSLLCAGART